jgi:hypothetical protein
MIKAARILAGVLVGLFLGGFVGYWVGSLLYQHECGVVKGPLIFMSSLLGIPIGGVVCALIAHQLGRLSEQTAKRRNDDNPEAKIRVAGWREEGQVLAERSGVVRVRVEFTSYVNHDAVRGDLERAGLVETDERTPIGKAFSSGSVNRVTGTIDVGRLRELAALSFVQSVEGSMDGSRG